MDLAKEFFSVFSTGTTEQMKGFLEKDQSLVSSKKNKEGVTAVMMALYCGRKDLAELFLSAGAELSIFEAAALGDLGKLASFLQKDRNAVNSVSSDGFSPLHLACFMGQADAAKYLIKNGAALEATSANGSDLKPINSAAACRNLDAANEIVKTLLSAGASPLAKQKGGYSALHSAAANGNLPLVKLLIEAGADRSALSDDEKTPLQFAQERNRAEVIGYLSEQ